MEDQTVKWRRDPKIEEFMRACCEDSSTAEELLHESPELLDAPAATVSGETPLHWLAVEGQSEAVRFLIRCGARLDTRDCYGGTPLFDAASLGDQEMVSLLLAAGADPNAIAGTSGSPLHAAAASEKCRPDLIELLLKSGADPHARDGHGNTPRQVAVAAGNMEAASVLATVASKRPAC